jgi:hypothetical protein
MLILLCFLFIRKDKKLNDINERSVKSDRLLGEIFEGAHLVALRIASQGSSPNSGVFSECYEFEMVTASTQSDADPHEVQIDTGDVEEVNPIADRRPPSGATSPKTDRGH